MAIEKAEKASLFSIGINITLVFLKYFLGVFSR